MTLFILPIVSPANFSFPAVFNFGDSNSDTGGLAAGVAFPVGPPNGQTYFLMPSGRFCDGRLIIDFLSNLSFVLTTSVYEHAKIFSNVVIYVNICNCARAHGNKKNGFSHLAN